MGNDEFFLPDDTWHFWDALGNDPVPNYLQIIPNCGHDFGCAFDKMLEGSISMYYAFMSGSPLPKISWKRWGGETEGKIEIRSNQTFLATRTWSATSMKGRRDIGAEFS